MHREARVSKSVVRLDFLISLGAVNWVIVAEAMLSSSGSLAFHTCAATHTAGKDSLFVPDAFGYTMGALPVTVYLSAGALLLGKSYIMMRHGVRLVCMRDIA